MEVKFVMDLLLFFEFRVCLFCIFKVRMKENSEEFQNIYRVIKFIQEQEQILQKHRQQLNHELMFNLKDAFLHLSNKQSLINIKDLANFLSIQPIQPSLQALFYWNNHQSSLNLTFSQFSALLISRQNKLLAKMTIERQQMGAIPNFLLDIVKNIMIQEIKVHQFCLKHQLQDEQQLTQMLQGITDQQGSIDEEKLYNFMQHFMDQSSRENTILEPNNFTRYLYASGNLAMPSLKYLWYKPIKSSIVLETPKKNQLTTYISNKKLTISSPKNTEMRSEYFDCINRSHKFDTKDIREVKSIQKHIKRVHSVHHFDKFYNEQGKDQIMYKLSANLLIFLLQIIMIERDTQRLKIQLRLSPDFYPVLFYESIPKDKNGLVNPLNFKEYLQSFGYSVTITQIYFLFKRYESQSGKMSFNEFCSIFDVSDPEYNLLQKNRFIQSLQDISRQTKKMFFKSLKKTMNNEEKILKIKQQMLVLCSDMMSLINFIFQPYENAINFICLVQIYKEYLNLDFHIKNYRMLCQRLKKGQVADYLQKSDFVKEFIFAKASASAGINKKR